MPDIHTTVIRDARPGDIATATVIERMSFSDPWSAPMLRSHMYGDVNLFLVATDGATSGAIVGYAIAYVIAGESELLNIAVHPEHRGRAIGTALLDQLMARCHARGAAVMALDVRESNIPARALYERHGFVIVGRRRGYYHHPDEDGLLMRAELPYSATGQPSPSPQ